MAYSLVVALMSRHQLLPAPHRPSGVMPIPGSTSRVENRRPIPPRLQRALPLPVAGGTFRERIDGPP